MALSSRCIITSAWCNSAPSRHAFRWLQAIHSRQKSINCKLHGRGCYALAISDAFTANRPIHRFDLLKSRFILRLTALTVDLYDMTSEQFHLASWKTFRYRYATACRNELSRNSFWTVKSLIVEACLSRFL